MPSINKRFTFPGAGAEDLSPFETGDMLLVLRRNGAVQAINLGYDRSRLNLSPQELTEDDRTIQANAKKLIALALAASNEKLMAILVEISEHPDLVDYDALSSAAQRLH